LPFDTLAIFCKFLFPALNFLVVYGLVLYLTKKKSFALLGATAMLLAQEIAPISITALIDTFSFNSPFHHFLLFSRPINPQVNAIFFFLTLWALAALWHQPERKRYAWLAGIATGILGYLYFFYWNFTTILLGIMFVASLCMRDRMRMKKVLAALGISLVVALPYLITMIEMLGAGTASVGKNYILTHRVIIEKIMLFPLALLGVMMAWKYIKYRSIKLAHPFQFLLLLVLAGIAASNQQVIHGMEIQQHHYHFMTNIPVFIIVMSILVAMAIERYCHKYVRPTIALLVILLFFQAASIQAASYKYWKPIFAEYQAYAPVFEWLNKNSAYNDIIYASETISQLIPTYTHDDVYSALHLSVYPVPLERLEHNYFIYMYLEGIRENTVRDYLFKEENRNRIGQHLFEGQYWRAMCGSFGCFPDSVIEDLIIKYKNFLKKPFEQNFKKYRVNYVMWDSRENPEWNVSKHSFLELATSTYGVLLFSVR
jgi:hypothetical protein